MVKGVLTIEGLISIEEYKVKIAEYDAKISDLTNENAQLKMDLEILKSTVAALTRKVEEFEAKSKKVPPHSGNVAKEQRIKKQITNNSYLL